MGYDVSRIGVGQVIMLIGLMTTLVSNLFLNRLVLVPGISPGLPILLAWTNPLVFLVGCIVTASGVLEGANDSPFDLFVIGWIMFGGGVGIFVAAGITHWDSAVNPLWGGPGPKPEAALLGLYACLQTVVSVVAILRSLPPILRETRRMARV